MALLGLSGFVSGCFSYRAGEADRAKQVATLEPVDGSVWPARSLDEMRRLHEVMPRELPDYSLPGGVALTKLRAEKRDEYLALEPVMVLANTLTTHGLLRVYEVPEAYDSDTVQYYSPFRGVIQNIISGFDANASFYSEWWINTKSAVITTDEAGNHSMRLVPWELPERFAPLEGLSVRIPTADEVPLEVKGTIFHFNGLMSTVYERDAVQRLRDLGWAVVEFDTHSSVSGKEFEIKVVSYDESDPKVVRMLRDLYDLHLENVHWVNERSPGTLVEPSFEEFLVRQQESKPPLKRPGYSVSSASDVPRVGREIAEDVDSLLAEHAYAAEAVLAYIKEFRSDLPRPIVLAGFSAGALVVPSVALRIKEDIGAMVLVSPVSHIYELGRKSEISNGGMNFLSRDGFEITGVFLDEVGAHYLANSKLDAHHIVSRLADIPTLVIYADNDTWVPTALTRAFLADIGMPDRIVHSGGHRTLFFFLKGQMRRVDRWLVKNTQR